jgi:guanylate kinase
MKRKLIAITGPSCGGKTTLKNQIVEDTAGRVMPVVTTTTRVSRVGEVDGTDYHFRSEGEFKTLVEERKMLEWIQLDDNLYGVEKKAILDACGEHGIAVVVVNPDGILALRPWCSEHGIEMISVCATAPVNTLKMRLAKRRGIASRDEILKRAERIESEVNDCLSRAGCDLLVSGGVAKSVGNVLRAIR